MKDETSYWFPAKTYGWGWGLPKIWQGWLVIVVFAVVLAVAALVLLPAQNAHAFRLVALFDTLGLVAVCLVKGEPPRWRWGGKE